MELKLKRGKSHSDHNGFTIGELILNGKTIMYTMEDEHRDVKVDGETRIPAGKYKIELQTESRFKEKYIKLFGKQSYKGMLHICNVPGFEGVLIHIGNFEKDTKGCILVGTEKDEAGAMIGNSTAAYSKLYPMVSKAILAGEKVTIEII